MKSANYELIECCDVVSTQATNPNDSSTPGCSIVSIAMCGTAYVRDWWSVTRDVFHSCVRCTLPVRYGKACTVPHRSRHSSTHATDTQFMCVTVEHALSVVVRGTVPLTRSVCISHALRSSMCFRCCSARNSTRASGIHFPHVAILI